MEPTLKEGVTGDQEQRSGFMTVFLSDTGTTTYYYCYDYYYYYYHHYYFYYYYYSYYYYVLLLLPHRQRIGLFNQLVILISL